MRSQSSGPSTTTLFFLFLVVLALVGVFGIPQFAPVIASPSDADEALGESLDHMADAGTGQSAEHGIEELFAPIDSPAATEEQSSAEPVHCRATPPADHQREKTAPRGPRERSTRSAEADGRWALEPTKGVEMTEPGDGHPGVRPSPEPPRPERQPDAPWALASVESDSPHAMPASFQERAFAEEGRGAAEGPDGTREAPAQGAGRPGGRRGAEPGEENRGPLTWRSAVHRLNELGIEEFRLTSGHGSNVFLFSCFFTPADNPRVTHRFEAEADAPLRAVQKVLDQIDEWLAGR